MLMSDYTSKLLNLEDVIITGVENISDQLHIYIELPRGKHVCPVCGSVTDRIHDYRMQTIKDVPLARDTFLHLRKRRYRCSCGKRFFEKNAFLPRYYRVTSRLVTEIIFAFKKTISAKEIGCRYNVSLSDKRVIYRHTKTGKLQSVPLCSQMAKILSEYMGIRGGAPEDYLFCTVYGEMMSENALSCAIKKYNHKRGVSRTSIHLFRHTFARKFLVDCGGDALILQKLLGHSTLAMTKHYCAIYDTDISDNFDSFSPLAQLTKEKVRIHK